MTASITRCRMAMYGISPYPYGSIVQQQLTFAPSNGKSMRSGFFLPTTNSAVSSQKRCSQRDARARSTRVTTNDEASPTDRVNYDLPAQELESELWQSRS